MKKAKIMLVAITVFAAVGGMLAFKVQTLGAGNYCTTDQTPVAATACNQFDDLRPAIASDNDKFTVWYKETQNQNCGSGLQCEAASISFVAE